MKIKTYTCDDEPKNTGSKFTKPRRPGNKHTWIIDLTTTDIDTRTAAPDSVIESSTYGVGKVSYTKPGQIDRCQLHAYPTFCHAILKHTYLTVTNTQGFNYSLDPVPNDLNYQLNQLSEKLIGVTKLELVQLEPDERPQEYRGVMADSTYSMNSSVPDFAWKEDQIPEGWSFFDEELIKHLNRLWKKHELKEAKEASKSKNDDGKGEEEKKEKKGGDGRSQEGGYTGDI